MKLTLFFAVFQLSVALLLQAQLHEEKTRFPTCTTSTHYLVQNVQKMTKEEIKKYVDDPTPHVFIVDARPASKDEGSRIPSAKPIPFDATLEHVSANLPDKNALIILYCQNNGCRASNYLADQLVKWGYQHVFVYPEGLEGWLAAGYAIDHGIPANKSRMRIPLQGLPNPDYQKK